MLASLARTVLAAALAGEAMWLAAELVGGNSGLGALARLAVGGVVGAAVYVAVLAAVRAPELQSLRRRIAVGPSTARQ